MAEFKYHIQIMAFIAELRIIETDRLAAVVAAAALITAAAVCIADRRALITCFRRGLFRQLIIPQFIGCIFIFKSKLAVTPDLTALYSEPGAFFVSAVVAQLAHAFQ